MPVRRFHFNFEIASILTLISFVDVIPINKGNNKTRHSVGLIKQINPAVKQNKNKLLLELERCHFITLYKNNEIRKNKMPCTDSLSETV